MSGRYQSDNGQPTPNSVGFARRWHRSSNSKFKI